MPPVNLQPYDMKQLAENGKRRGRTTGTCAAAAAKAAVLLLQHEQLVESVCVRLPDERHYLEVPIASVEHLQDQAVRAKVVKDAGDDPDATDGATIVCQVRRNDGGEIRFFAGDGVGIVMEPGIRVAIGQPAINPVPRQMISQAVWDAVGADQGFDIAVGCANGVEIAKRTFNPRLGIKGGISILGTTGIVEPLSLAAYMASIEVYIKVALGDNSQMIALLPGNIGLGFASRQLHLPKKRIVHISNYVGFALDHVQAALVEADVRLEDLFLLGHPGKLAKLLSGNWDTHSRSSGMAMQSLAQFAADFGLPHAIVSAINQSNTVEAVIEMFDNQPGGQPFFRALEMRLGQLAGLKVENCMRLQVKLFDMKGNPLSPDSQNPGIQEA